MRYRVAVCDDVQKDAEAIACVVKEWAKRERISVTVGTFPCAEEFLFQYEEQKDYHILLLDVEMKGMSGIELAKRIRRCSDRAEIIFITSHFEFSGEGYEVDALHYLVKPAAPDKLMEVLSKAARRLAREPAFVTIACGGETHKLYETDILYIEAFLHYIVIHVKSRGHTKDVEYRLKESISAFGKKLGEDFYRTHRSYLVSLRHVERISRTSVVMDSGDELPLARGKYDGMNRAFIERG